MIRFATATLLPIPLLALSAMYGSWFVVLAVTYMTGLTYALDHLVRTTEALEASEEFPAANGLLVAIGLFHFVILAIIVAAISGQSLGNIEKIALFVAAGMYFGQVGNSTAHELIHRGQRSMHKLGMWMYISLLFGHHTSAHVLVHHRYVATDNDPSSARLGETYYAFVIRAWFGSFRAGFQAEQERIARINRPSWKNPYVLYVGGAAAFILLAALTFGPVGAICYIALAFYSTSQLLLSDYVQHYGLRREAGSPVSAQHSWNSPHWFSSALMLNAPRHSDHHAHPAKEFTELSLPNDGPTLPRSLPAMATLALFPSLWRRVMDPRAQKWQD